MSKASSGPRPLPDRLRDEIIIGDGAMGTLLYSRGVPLESNFEHLNLVRPELVRQVHEDYVRAGAQLLETNTFGANALRLSAVGLEHRTVDINRAGVRLARQAAGTERLVAGAVGPLLRPKGEQAELPAEQKRQIFRQQLTVLADAGVDLFILETFADLDDLELALAEVALLGLPAVTEMAFLEGGRTREGVTAEEAGRRLTAAGAGAIGANCGSGPRELHQVLARLAAVSSLPLAVFPNSGFPQYVDGRYIYLATPDYFAAMGRDLVAAGATLLGGCCGTTPDHIAALAGALAGLRPARRVPVTPRIETAEPVSGRLQPVAGRRWLERHDSKPVVTVELDPPRGFDCDKVLAAARRLAAAGVDAINLAENPLARIRMGNIALARQIQEATGVEVIVHVTCRDRNLIGLHSELMGAHLLGIRNILAVTGDPVAVGGEAGATSVFDLNSISLLGLLAALNNGRNLLGNDLGGHSEFLLGAAFNPNLPNLDGQLRRLEKKVAAGARFVQTQPVYAVEVLDRLLAATAGLDIPVLVGILPLVSERNAEFLHNEVPGISLSPEVRQRMCGTCGDSGVREGLAIARELVAAGAGRVAGWYLMPPFGRVDLVLALLAMIRGGASED